MDYFDTATTGNAVDFGDARAARYEMGLWWNGISTRGCFHGGSSPVPAAIEYVTMSSNGGANDFGDSSGYNKWGWSMCKRNKFVD